MVHQLVCIIFRVVVSTVVSIVDKRKLGFRLSVMLLFVILLLKIYLCLHQFNAFLAKGMHYYFVFIFVYLFSFIGGVFSIFT